MLWGLARGCDTGWTHMTCRLYADVLIVQDPSHLLSGEKRSPESGYTHTHTCFFLFFFTPVVLFTGQRVNKAAVTFLWEASVTGRLTTINFRTGRGDSCKEKARRIRNGPRHHLSSGLAKDTENSSVCSVQCVCAVCVYQVVYYSHFGNKDLFTQSHCGDSPSPDND